MAFTIQLGSFAFNEEIAASDESGDISSGQPNPTRISWSKENIIKTHEIPWPSHKTCRTSKMTLWKCDMDFKIVTNTRVQQIQKMIDDVGPYYLRTPFKSAYMYIESFTANSEEGKNDHYFVCSMKLKERND
ncbi:hypothetical protein [Bacteroides sp.]|uniref:hypothetical protein n=1 Tax=Bacteroides sp. TaxID=29523 RepID=UPI00260F6A51|nr:hypothetical protein [Bacteroides sp.]MDD3040725.1 hypothetical protein [Bacteroides sp.]